MNHHPDYYSTDLRKLHEFIDARFNYASEKVREMGQKYETLMSKLNEIEHKAGNDAAMVAALNHKVEMLTVERDVAVAAVAATAVVPAIQGDGATSEELDTAIAKLDAMLPVVAAPAA